MAARSQWLGCLAALAVVAAVGGGLWYVSRRGWLAPVYARVRQLITSKGGEAKAGNGGMDMNMPGMNMGSMGGGQADTTSGVPSHAAVMIPPEIQQRIGVTTGRVELAPLRMSVRTMGIIRPDETRVSHVHLRTEGWVEKLFVNYTGQVVRQGDPLLAIYSPQFLTTQREYLTALRAGRNRTLAGAQRALAEAARRRLELWDIPRREIDQLEQTGEPLVNLTLRSPQAGTVLVKNAFEGQYVTPKDELYVVADLSTVWVQAKVYEYELPHVELGQPAAVTVPALPERRFSGKVVFIQPTVDPTTRTVEVRVELPNRDGEFKPAMFAQVVIRHTMGEGLLAPASAVIRTGLRDIAFRAEPGNRFVPVAVEISPIKFGDRFQILKGLHAGDRVVTSADFLIDSESRLRFGAGGSMAGMAGMDMGGMKGMSENPGPRTQDPGPRTSKP